MKTEYDADAAFLYPYTGRTGTPLFVMKKSTTPGHEEAPRTPAGKMEETLCQAEAEARSGFQPSAFNLFK